MSYTLEFGKIVDGNLTYFDVSKYVIDEIVVPYTIRNDDYTLVSDYMDITLTQTYASQSFNIDDYIKISSGSNVLYKGQITSKTYIPSELNYKYEIENNLIKANDLKRYKMLWSEMSSSISPYLQQKTIYGKLPLRYWINAYDLVKAIFSKVGITLDTTHLMYQLRNMKLMEYHYVSTGSQVYHTEETRLIGTDQLFFYEPMLWGINQKLIYTRDEVEGSATLRENVITLYDMLSYLSSILRLTFYQKSDTEYYVVSKVDIPVRNNNVEEYYIETIEAPNAKGLKMSYTMLDGRTQTPNNLEYRYSYYPFLPGNPSNLKFWIETVNLTSNYVQSYETDYENGEKNIDWYHHFILFEILPDFTGLGNTIRMIPPRVDSGTNATLIKNIFDYNIGKCYTKEYESQVETGLYSSVNENYITIDMIDGRNPYSTIKIKTYIVE